MISSFERDYASIARTIMRTGKHEKGRNGYTRSVFGTILSLPDAGDNLPILHGREIYWQGILGEFAAFLRGPKRLSDFVYFGCNYWKKWADANGDLEVDYGNQWIDFLGVNQLAEVVDSLKNDPHGRRHLISSWRPDRLRRLSLPCCHLLYQWYVNVDNKLEMIWYQRSADWMIGVPSDMILAAVFNKCMAIEAGFDAGPVTMIFGDTHIYEEHEENVFQYLGQVRDIHYTRGPRYNVFTSHPLLGPELFTPSHFDMFGYDPQPPVKFEVKA